MCVEIRYLSEVEKKISFIVNVHKSKKKSIIMDEKRILLLIKIAFLIDYIRFVFTFVDTDKEAQLYSNFFNETPMRVLLSRLF